MAELGLNIAQNNLIKKSDNIFNLIKKNQKNVDDVSNIFISVFRNTINPTMPNKNNNVRRSVENLKSIHKVFNTFIDNVNTVIKDTSFETTEANEEVYKTLEKLSTNTAFTKLINDFIDDITDPNNDQFNTNPKFSNTNKNNLVRAYSDIPKMFKFFLRKLKEFIDYKKANETYSSRVAKKGIVRGSLEEYSKNGFGGLYNKAKGSVLGKMGIDAHDSKSTRTRKLGGLALGGLGIVAGMFMKSSGVVGGAGFYLKKRYDTIEKNREIYKKKINDVYKAEQDIKKALSENDRKKKIEQGKFNLRADGYLAGGGSFKAKKNTNVMLGDNPRGVEAYNINSPFGNISGTTSGKTLFNLQKGSTISAKPLSGIGVTKVDTSSLSRFGGGTEEIETKSVGTNAVVNAIEKLRLEEKRFHDDQMSRMDDSANLNKGFSKSIFNPFAKREEKVGEGSKGIGDVIKGAIIEGITQAIMSRLFATGLTRALLPSLGKLLVGSGPLAVATGVTVATMYGYKKFSESETAKKMQENEDKDLTPQQKQVRDLQELRRRKGENSPEYKAKLKEIKEQKVINKNQPQKVQITNTKEVAKANVEAIGDAPDTELLGTTPSTTSVFDGLASSKNPIAAGTGKALRWVSSLGDPNPTSAGTNTSDPNRGMKAKEKTKANLIALGANGTAALDKYVGLDYQMGAKSGSAIDCSGLSKKVVKDITGQDIGDGSANQRNNFVQNGKFIPATDFSQAQPGDVAFFNYSGRNGAGQADHVGVYLGTGADGKPRMLHNGNNQEKSTIKVASTRGLMGFGRPNNGAKIAQALLGGAGRGEGIGNPQATNKNAQILNSADALKNAPVDTNKGMNTTGGTTPKAKSSTSGTPTPIITKAPTFRETVNSDVMVMKNQDRMESKERDRREREVQNAILQNAANNNNINTNINNVSGGNKGKTVITTGDTSPLNSYNMLMGNS